MPKRIVLDQAYIDRIRKKRYVIIQQTQGMTVKKVRCAYCSFRTIDKYEDLVGHFSAQCPRCGQIVVYNAADCRRLKGFGITTAYAG